MEKEKIFFYIHLIVNGTILAHADSISNTYSEQPSSNKIIQVDSDNNFIRGKKRIIATIGVNDLIIIDSDDATLIKVKTNLKKLNRWLINF